MAFKEGQLEVQLLFNNTLPDDCLQLIITLQLPYHTPAIILVFSEQYTISFLKIILTVTSHWSYV